MNWLFVAIVSRFLSGSVAVTDKLLLKKSYPNPWGYSFWIGILGLASIVLIPFGFSPPPWPEALLALATGGIFIAAVFLNVFSLFFGEASVAAILIGATLPVFTLFFGVSILHLTLVRYETTGFLLLLLGSLLLFLAEKPTVRFKVFALALASAALYGLADALTKLVFYDTNFITGFTLIKMGAAVSVLILFLVPRAKKHILPKKGAETDFKNKPLFIANRVIAGLGSISIYYAISLGNPALVDSTMGLQYVFIFLGGILLLKERFRGWVLAAKLGALVAIIIGIVWLAGGDYLAKTAPSPNRSVTWGVTFSEKFAGMMGLDWKEAYRAVLDDLHAKDLRLIAYWDEIEVAPDRFNFSDLDYQVKTAEAHDTHIILAIGQRVPRWPECHAPAWTQALGKETREKDLLQYLAALVNRYKNSAALKYWQVENEPFLLFGECPLTDPAFLDTEIALVRSLDLAHPVMLTDGGEMSIWYRAAKRGDVFGTTMYRRVHNRFFGQIQYPLPPEFFRIKEALIRETLQDRDKKFVVIELGAEPWLEHQLYETSVADQLKVFDIDFFKDTIAYAKAAGFDEYYLWGAEWWYWMKTKQNHPEFWNYASTLFRN